MRQVIADTRKKAQQLSERQRQHEEEMRRKMDWRREEERRVEMLREMIGLRRADTEQARARMNQSLTAKRRSEWAENARAREAIKEDYREMQEDDYLNRLKNKKRVELFEVRAKVEKRQ